jgi:hypothetical protein
MTSGLRKLTGPQFMADHERRLAALERRLAASVSDPPRRAATAVAPVTVHWNNPGGDLDGGWSEFSQMWASAGADLSWFEFPPSYAPTDLTRIFLTKPGMWLCSLQVGYSSSPAEARIEANAAPVCRATDKVTGGGAFNFDQVTIDTSFPEVRVNVDVAGFQTAYMSLTWFPGEPTLEVF